MAKYLEYKLHAPMNGHGMSTPNFITNGGHWYNDNKMISIEPDEDPEYYVPDTVKVFTADQLKERQLAVHAAAPYKVMGENGMPTEVDMSDAQVETMVDEWVAATA